MNNLATTESEIVEMGLRLAGAGRQINLTESEILSFAGALSSVGIAAESGGTAFSRVFLEMNTAVMKGGDALKGFAKVAGVSTADFADAFEKDASGAVLTFIKGLDKISKSGGNTAEVLDDLGLGEIRVRDALMRAAGASDVFTDAMNIGNKSWKENTALSNEAQQRYETFASKLSMLKNRLTDLAITIGGPVMEVLSRLIDALEPVITFIENLALKFSEASMSTQLIVGAILVAIPVLLALEAIFFAMIAAIGAVISGFTAIAGAIGVTATGLLTFIGIAAGVVTAIGAIIAIVIWAYNEFEWFRDVVNAVWEAVKLAFQTALDFILGIVKTIVTEVVAFAKTQLAKFQALWDEHGAAIVALISTHFRNMWEIIKFIMTSIGTTFKIAWNTITAIVRVAWEALKTIVGIGIDIITGLIDVGMSILKGDWEGAWDAIKGIAEDIWNGIESFFESVSLFEIGKDIIGGLISGLASMVDGAIQAAKNVGSNIKNTLTKYFSIKSPSRLMKNEVGKMIGLGLIEGMQGELSAISKMATKVAEAATPEQPKLAGFEVGDMRGYAGEVSAKLRSDVYGSSTKQPTSETHNYRGMLEGSTFIVREDADIDRIAEELARKQKEAKLRKGRR